MRLIITLPGSTRPFIFNVEMIEELVIGRLVPETGWSPDIDLQEHGGQEKGVSRRHAAIIRRDDTLYLVDLSSPNATFLNEVRLFPQQPRALRDGDTLRVGRLILQVKLDDPAQTEPLE